MQLVKVSELIPHPRNNEFFDDVTGKRWDEFLESIKTSGVIEPIVITEKKVIISGHQRVRACKELGIEEIMAEIKLYEDDEKKIVKDLIETNVRQRGTIGGSDQQIVARVEALKDWYGVYSGKRNDLRTNGTQVDDGIPVNQADILKILGLTEKQYKTAKQITDKAIPEVQQLIDKGTVSRRTVADLIAKLSPEDQKKLVDILPEDVKITASTVDAYINKLREELVGNANKLAEERNTLMGQVEQYKRENNELRSGNLPISEEAKKKQQKLMDERREYYEKYEQTFGKYQEANKNLEILRQMLADNQKEITRLKNASNGSDDAVIEMQNEIDSLRQSLESAERKANDLEYELSEKEDAIKNLERENKEGYLRKALRMNETQEEINEREIQSLMSDIQMAISDFQTNAEGFLVRKDSFPSISKPILKVLVTTCSQAVNAGNMLKIALMNAVGDYVEDGYSENDDSESDYSESDLTDEDLSGLELTLGA